MEINHTIGDTAISQRLTVLRWIGRTTVAFEIAAGRGGGAIALARGSLASEPNFHIRGMYAPSWCR
jgi:hypothetical protein